MGEAGVCDTDFMGRRCVAAALLGAQLALAGCVSVRQAGTRTVPGPGGSVAVTVFADDAARRDGKPGPAGVLGELERRDGERWVPVFRSLDPAWAVAGLPAGAYRLRVPARLDGAGNVVPIDEKAVSLDVREGRVTEAEVVLKHVSTGAVVAGTVAVAVAAVLLHEWLDDHDLPSPPLPPPEVLDAVVWITIDLHAAAAWSGPADGTPPMVASHFPTAGALVAARRPRLVLAFSEALHAGEIEPAGVTVLAEKGGLIPGVVAYDAASWWLTWQPQTDLPSGDTIHVTLAADAVEDLAGNEMGTPLTFTFATAP
jgi:hypothetical protein